jgi:hypothetical protein
MTPDVARYLNRTVFVSIPTLFEDGACRPFKLLGAELNGLWLQSDELARRLLPDDRQDFASLAPAVFVPFAQIAGVLVVTGMPQQSPQDKPSRPRRVPATTRRKRSSAERGAAG